MDTVYNFGKLSVFWVWNVTFIIFTCFGLAPIIGHDLVRAGVEEGLPGIFFLTLLFLMVIPIACTNLAIRKFKNQSDLLLKFFYGVEVPLLLICLLRLFLLRETTYASSFILGGILAGAVIYYLYLVREVDLKNYNPIISLPFTVLLLIVSLYGGTLLLFFILPMIWSLLVYLASLDWLWVLIEAITTIHIWLPEALASLLIKGWMLPVGFLLFFLSIALFFIFPFAIVIFYAQAWYSSFTKLPVRVASVITVGVITLWGAGFYIVDQQPQEEVFQLLSKELKTPQDKKIALDRQDEIKTGLLNAYLHPYRYLSPKGDVNIITGIYRDAFGITRETAGIFQSWFNVVASPVLYRGERGDDIKAASLYASMFDISMQKGEQKKILNALNATAMRNGIEAGMLSINQKKVHLSKQHITTEQKGSVTTVELYEVYENKTKEMQEIFYNFSLPENAVITGLWLSDSAKKVKYFPYVISPRGAAQKVYKAQVARRVDPALLEQVGPRQYRLRVFPIPVQRIRRRQRGWTNEANNISQEMHMWLSYSVLNDSSTNLLPRLLEKRNIFWTDKTIRTLNNKTLEAVEKWMPEIAYEQKKNDQEIKTKLITKDAIFLIKALKTESILRNLESKTAILIDTSYSMGKQKKEIQKSLKWLSDNKIAFDTFMHTGNSKEKPTPIKATDLSDTPFWGSVKNSDLWNQAARIQSSKQYNAVFVLTDQGSYELASDKQELEKSETPIWFVHLNQLAPAYVDTLLKKIMEDQNGIATSLQEAMQKFSMKKTLATDSRQVGGYLWRFEKVSEENAESTFENKPLSQIAAKHLIDYLATQIKQVNPEQLDTIHKIAKDNSVLTPYSSMIVLVNDAQRKMLEEAEKAKDRFSRQQESGREVLGAPANPMVTGVPEPEVWALIIITFLSLGYFYRRRRRVSKMP